MNESPTLPALLVSYFYVKPFLRKKHTFLFRDWVLDSGAFSAANSGATIDLDAYIDFCKETLATDPTLTEVFALDVIGDAHASRKNADAMWTAGVPAIPCFHYGQPWAELEGIARDFPKIALGGAVGLHAKTKLEWARQCFARVWPKRIHGFGMNGEHLLLSLPFHSVDASNWEAAPARFGRWQAFGGAGIPLRGGQLDLRVEIEWYMALERRMRLHWRKEMAQLGDADAPTVRLAFNPSIGDRALATQRRQHGY